MAAKLEQVLEVNYDVLLAIIAQPCMTFMRGANTGWPGGREHARGIMSDSANITER